MQGEKSTLPFAGRNSKVILQRGMCIETRGIYALFLFFFCNLCYWAPLVAQMVKNLLALMKTWVWSLGWEDPLRKGMATCSSILAWRIPWTEEPGGATVHGLLYMPKVLSIIFHLYFVWSNTLLCRESNFYFIFVLLRTFMVT